MTDTGLVDAIAEFLGDGQLMSREDIAAVIEREIASAGRDSVPALRARLADEHGWGYYEPDPLARRIHHVLADRFLTSDSTASGLEHLEAVPPGPLVIVANHLSYADANVIETLLSRAGAATIANRLTALAGPKIFSSRQRRFSSLCFGTIKVPQSADVSSEEAALHPREVARAARQAIEVAHERLRAGDALLLFGEGTRSRTGAMQPMLPAVARYLEPPDTVVLPVALSGSESLFAIDDLRPRPATAQLRIGAPVLASAVYADADGRRREVVDAIGRAIASLLPPAYRGVYAH